MALLPYLDDEGRLTEGLKILKAVRSCSTSSG